MEQQHATRKLRFGLAAALFVLLLLAGLFAGYRIGHRRGYVDGNAKRQSEEPTTVTYDVSAAATHYFTDPDTRLPRVVDKDHPNAVADLDSLIELLTTVHPTTWQEVGGRGSIYGYPDSSRLVVFQYPYVQNEIESVIESLTNQSIDGAIPKNE